MLWDQIKITLCVFWAYLPTSGFTTDIVQQNEILYCDAKEWHNTLIGDLSSVDLSGRKASYVRKVNQYIEDYDDKTMLKDCSILNKIKFFIIEDNDDDAPSLHHIDITNRDNQGDVIKLTVVSDRLSELNKPKSEPDEILEANEKDIRQGEDINSHPSRNYTEKIIGQSLPEELCAFLSQNKSSNEEGHIKNYEYDKGEDLESEFEDDPTELGDDNDADYNNSYLTNIDTVDAVSDKQASVGSDTGNEETINNEEKSPEELLPNRGKQANVNELDENYEFQSPNHNIEGEISNEKLHGVCPKYTSCKYTYYLNVPISDTSNRSVLLLLNKISFNQKGLMTNDIARWESEVRDNGSAENGETIGSGVSHNTRDSNKSPEEQKTDIKYSDKLRNKYASNKKEMSKRSYEEDYAMKDEDGRTLRGIVSSDRDNTELQLDHEIQSAAKVSQANHPKGENTNSNEGETNETTESELILNQSDADKKIDEGDARDLTTANSQGNSNNKNQQPRKGYGSNSQTTYDHEPRYHKPGAKMWLIMANNELKSAKEFEKIKLDLVKLENKILKQNVNTKIDAGSIRHMENHILKLENSILKLNLSCNQLQREYNSLKRKQKIQNSNMKLLFYISNKFKTCPNTEVATKVNLERITEQKAKVWELSQIVAYQTENMNRLQKRSDDLEEQNRQLFKMMLDQSALATNLMSRLNEINTNNVKANLENKELKLLVDKALSAVAHVDTVKAKQQNRIHQKVEDREEDNAFETKHNSDVVTNEVNTNRNVNVRRGNMAIDSGKQTHSGKEKRTNVLTKQERTDPSSNTVVAKSEINENNSLTKKIEKTQNLSNIKIGTQTQEKTQTKSQDKEVDIHLGNQSAFGENKSDVSQTQQETKKDDIEIRQELADNKPHQEHFSDCHDVYKHEREGSGIHKIYINGMTTPVNVYCDDMTNTDGGWTIILRRSDGQQDFYQSFAKYKDGFGSVSSDHYIGNEVIHFLTSQKSYVLRVELSDWEGNSRYATYDHFSVDGESDKFKLHIGGYSGSAGDGLSKHNKMGFSTFDMDNDLVVKEFGGSCATRFHGAGWYYKCYQSNLMGVYYKGGVIPHKKYDGITWKPWKGANYSLKSIKMSLRPKGV